MLLALLLLVSVVTAISYIVLRRDADTAVEQFERARESLRERHTHDRDET